MKKLVIIILSLATYSCVVPVSIGNKAIAKPEPKINVKSTLEKCMQQSWKIMPKASPNWSPNRSNI